MPFRERKIRKEAECTAWKHARLTKERNKEMSSDFKLPVVTGRIECSNADFERACLVHIERLQNGIGDYDSAMLATFYDAVRIVREYSDMMKINS